MGYPKFRNLSHKAKNAIILLQPKSYPQREPNMIRQKKKNHPFFTFTLPIDRQINLFIKGLDISYSND